ncbi:16353_t:CDS:2 [Entrophospora sp. SA101]|nr:16353_t:CDS:2 [Entrophospora sp. SA101]
MSTRKRTTTVTNILKEKEHWLAITIEQNDLKKFRRSKWPQLEGALNIWVNNALNAQTQDITGNILKEKATYLQLSFQLMILIHQMGS